MRRTSVFLTLLGAGCLSAPPPGAERRPPPGTLMITPPAWALGGRPMAVLLEGATPQATVALAGSLSTTGTDACPSAIAPTCLDLSNPIVVLSAGRADAAGRRAMVSPPMPIVPGGRTVFLQGVQAGAAVGLTEVWVVRLLDPAGDDDGDQLTNGVEVARGLDPLDPDTDGDGLPDNEYEVYGSGPLVADTDQDGLDDGEEVQIGTSPWQHDTDGDRAPDGAELAFGSSPLDPDSDDDGLNDGQEFLFGSDPTTPDSDGDAADDAYEHALGTDPLNPDSDGDGLTDGFDPHPLASDADSDGLTDGEELILGTDPARADTDDDGLTDPQEAGVTSPTDPDLDDDGLFDGTELIIGTSPALADSDGDGLTDHAEVLLTLTAATTTDTDGDGVSDGDEHTSGRNPRGSSSAPGDGGAFDGVPAPILAEICDHALSPQGDYVQLYNAGGLPVVLRDHAVSVSVYYDQALGIDQRLITPLPRWAALAPGESWVIAQSTVFALAYGPPAQISSAMVLTGDEPVRLMRSAATAEDSFAPWRTPLLGTAWDYRASVVKRVPGVDQPVFETEDLQEWSFHPGAGAAMPFSRD